MGYSQNDVEYENLVRIEEERNEQQRFDNLSLDDQIKELNDRKKLKKKEDEYHKNLEEYSRIASVCEYLSELDFRKLVYLRKYMDRSNDELIKISKEYRQKYLDLFNRGYSR